MIRHPATRLLLAGLFLSMSAPGLLAQEKAEAVAPKQKLIQALLESEDEKSFLAAVAAAEKGKIAKQAILEARFLFLVDQGDFARVAALGPELEKQKAVFRIEDSVIFSVPEEFFAIIEYCHALAALEKRDQAGFEKHIKEAFWLSPRQAAAFAPHIERLRLEEAMSKIKIDFAQTYSQLADGKKVTLAALAQKSKYLVLHFWSPWSNEVEANLPDFLAMTEELTRNSIPVVSILIETGEDALEVAREFRAEIKAAKTGFWIVDNSHSSLAGKLRVQELPTVVLLDREGTVLFNGHPSQAGLWAALRKAEPGIKRPRLEPVE